jgi:transcriptional regulator with XRE-family HTH domain
MYLAERLLLLREAKHRSQGDIEKRTGLLRSYISRVENGHTVPSVGTLEKISQRLEVALYQLFYHGQESPEAPIFSDNGKEDWASQGKGKRLFMKLRPRA